jgi:phospholipase C
VSDANSLERQRQQASNDKPGAKMFRSAILPIPLTAMVLALAACGSNSSTTPAAVAPAATVSAQDALTTATPIKHLVVIYGENVSFDHYFGTYPTAANTAGEPAFNAAAGTPTVNNLTGTLLTANPNSTNAANLAIPIAANLLNPFRLDRTQANTADQNHAYTAEEKAYDNGVADAFPANTGTASAGGAGAFGTKAQVLGYFDGNTVTGMWNYAQHFAMSDNDYTDTYGPSTPGALEVVSGTTAGAVQVIGPVPQTDALSDGQGGLTEIGDADPAGDICSTSAAGVPTVTVRMTSKNIGDLLNAKNITWGGFMGGFNLQTVNPNGTKTTAVNGTNSICGRSTFSTVLNNSITDYTQHHNWFQYYTSTANPTHARPSATAAIGSSLEADGKTPEPANHEYDTADFQAAVSSGNFPSVAYIKAPAVGDGHPGNSDPLDEQNFDINLVNFIEQQPDWKNTAIIITYDDSDGWYDHRFATPTTASFDPTADQLNGPGQCTASGVTAGTGVNGGAVNGRCGPGTRTPFIVISPYANPNSVFTTRISQASVVRFIEDNWLGSQRIGQGSFDATAGSIMGMFNFNNGGSTPALYLDPNTGLPLTTPPTNIVIGS